MKSTIFVSFIACLLALANNGVCAESTHPSFYSARSCTQTKRGLIQEFDQYRGLNEKTFFAKTGYYKIEYFALRGMYKHLNERLKALKASVPTHQYDVRVADALDAAVLAGSYHLVRALVVDHGANVNGVDGDRERPLLLATSCDRVKSLRLLVDRAADLYVKTRNCKDAIWVALEVGDKRLINILLAGGFDPCVDETIWIDGHLASREQLARMQGLAGAVKPAGPCSLAPNGSR